METLWVVVVMSTVTCGSYLQRRCENTYEFFTATEAVRFSENYRASDLRFYEIREQQLTLREYTATQKSFKEIADEVEERLAITNEIENYKTIQDLYELRGKSTTSNSEKNTISRIIEYIRKNYKNRSK